MGIQPLGSMGPPEYRAEPGWGVTSRLKLLLGLAPRNLPNIDLCVDKKLWCPLSFQLCVCVTGTPNVCVCNWNPKC